uniref:Orotidine 5'-phosphate decarboxylase domain-containing protein n=1 Tax=Ignisphaera aggregans TaxID=334771 RepID=A0A7C5XHT6_9CREN
MVIFTTKLFKEVSKGPLLQIALDFTDLKQALEVALNVAKAGAHIIELGTPLIKTYGLKALIDLKNLIDNKLIVADLKTIDAIELELTPFAQNGAHAVTILSFIDDDIISDAIALCRELDIDLIIDLMYQKNPVEKAIKLADLGANIVNVHVGVDVQRKRNISVKQLLKEIEEIASSNIIVAVAGGIKPKDVKLFAEHGAKIIIIGSAITRHENPYKATIEALQNLQ